MENAAQYDLSDCTVALHHFEKCAKEAFTSVRSFILVQMYIHHVYGVYKWNRNDLKTVESGYFPKKIVNSCELNSFSYPDDSGDRCNGRYMIFVCSAHQPVPLLIQIFCNNDYILDQPRWITELFLFPLTRSAKRSDKRHVWNAQLF